MNPRGLLWTSHPKESAGPTAEQVQAALGKATEDPCPVTRTVAQRLLEALKERAASQAPSAPTAESP
ncbi:MAG: hypothetical protein FJ280_13495 [Planctomycetes bacterium]|nr:hypothetical protein [Planctomycetota bacterium]